MEMENEDKRPEVWVARRLMRRGCRCESYPIAYFASKPFGLKDIVLTGNLTQMSQASEIFDTLNKMFNMNFVIPENAQFSTVIGAALSSFDK